MTGPPVPPAGPQRRNVPAGPGNPAPLVALQKAGFRYRDAGAAALRDIDLIVRSGEAIAVLGPQGSGTSTLARLAAGLLSDRGEHSGTVGRNARVALLGDDPEAQLTGLSRSAAEEVSLPARFTGMPRHSLPGAVGQAMNTLGIAHLAGQDVNTLSGGERQLTALAGLLGLAPPLVILDQPGLALDARARAHLLRALDAHRQAGGAVLLTGHQHDELSAACDRVLFLDRGRLVGSAPTGSGAPDAPGTAAPWTRARGTHAVAADEPGPEAPRPATPSAGDGDASGDGRDSGRIPAFAALLCRYGVWDTRPASAADGIPGGPSGESPGTTDLPGSPSDDVLGASGFTGASGIDNPLEPGYGRGRERTGREVLLRVRGLRVRRGGRTVIDGVDLDLFAGTTTALLGPNGSGKSTLLAALAGLLGPAGAAGTLPHADASGAPSRDSRAPGRRRTGGLTPGSRRGKRPVHDVAGSVIGRDGTELGALPLHARARHLAWVGQDPGVQLSAATVRAELEGAVPLARHRRTERTRLRARRREQVDGIMERLGLQHDAATHPYDLSPARRKDLVIASALLLEPAALLLDEPTLGRDLAGMQRLNTLLKDFTGAGGTVLVATHDRAWASSIAGRTVRLSPPGNTAPSRTP